MGKTLPAPAQLWAELKLASSIDMECIDQDGANGNAHKLHFRLISGGMRSVSLHYNQQAAKLKSCFVNNSSVPSAEITLAVLTIATIRSPVALKIKTVVSDAILKGIH